MEYLTIQEVATLKGCSGSYISRMAKSGKIECLIETNASNNQPSYMIPISALPENLQTKYYSRLKQEAGTAPELKDSPDLKGHKKPVKRRFEEYTAAEREEIENDDGLFFIEINLRIGDSATAGIIASFNYIEQYLEHFVNGTHLESLETYMECVAWNSIVSRFYDEVIVNKRQKNQLYISNTQNDK